MSPCNSNLRSGSSFPRAACLAFRRRLNEHQLRDFGRQARRLGLPAASTFRKSTAILASPGYHRSFCEGNGAEAFSELDSKWDLSSVGDGLMDQLDGASSRVHEVKMFELWDLFFEKRGLVKLSCALTMKTHFDPAFNDSCDPFFSIRLSAPFIAPPSFPLSLLVTIILFSCALLGTRRLWLVPEAK